MSDRTTTDEAVRIARRFLDRNTDAIAKLSDAIF